MHAIRFHVLLPSAFTDPDNLNHPVGSTYVSRVRQQVLMKGAGLSPQPPLRPDPVGQVPHDDTLRSLSCGF